MLKVVGTCSWCGDEIIACTTCGGRHCIHNVIRCNTLKRIALEGALAEEGA